MPCYPYIKAVAGAVNVNADILDRTELRDLTTELQRIASQAQDGHAINISTPITRALCSVDGKTVGKISRGKLLKLLKELQDFECDRECDPGEA